MMRRFALLLTVSVLLCAPPPAPAGLYCSMETYASLPSQWRGFLLDQHALRSIGVKPPQESEAGPRRTAYVQAAGQLQQRLDRDAKLPPDAWADLGALYVRLGDPGQAVAVLRAAQRTYPDHFAIAANLGTAWQLTGELAQATAALQQAVRLAPAKAREAEQFHLKLVRLRLKRVTTPQELDDVFGVRYGPSADGSSAGSSAQAQREKLPAHAVAIVQQLALWLPADGRLLWQLAELSALYGDPASAAAMLDGCVVQFGMTAPELRRRRRTLHEAADALAEKQSPARTDHGGHAAALVFRSPRPLPTRIDPALLPPVSRTGVNGLPWALFAETTVGRPFRPAYPDYLKQLAGTQVALTGFIVPLQDMPEGTAFLLVENPVGCWYCAAPETTGIVHVTLPPGQAVVLRRGLVRVVGRLSLNTADPEDFLYAVRDARVGAVD